MSAKEEKICSKYQILVNAIDDICNNAPSDFLSYNLKGKTEDQKNNIRAKAYIHLYLLVKFGIQDFKTRHDLITDGANDGGIDAYYIDSGRKKLYIIQSKFRITESNYESKEIEFDEIVGMEIKNILSGSRKSETGETYNGKICGMQDAIAKVNNISKYNIEVVLLANLSDKTKTKIMNIMFSGYKYEIFNFERAYKELIFPLCISTYFQGDKVIIHKNIFGIKEHCHESFSNTSYGKCDVHLMFVPLDFIAEIMDEYKNSILKYNPRNYLTMTKNAVNKLIAATVNESNDDFALLNNGITMTCSDFQFTKQNGLEGSANVYIEDPQIINGGQTGITLARMLKENPENLCGKKVLLRIIATDQENKESQSNSSNSSDQDQYRNFINSISDATNMQSKIEEADRRANMEIQREFQWEIYSQFGLLYERKTGEFEEALHKKLIPKAQIIKRDKMIRCILALQGLCDKAMSAAKDKLFEEDTFNSILNTEIDSTIAVYAYLVYSAVEKAQKSNKNKENPVGGNGARYGKYAIVKCANMLTADQVTDRNKLENIDMLAQNTVKNLLDHWEEFEEYVRNKEENKAYFYPDTNYSNYYKSKNINVDIEEYWKRKKINSDNCLIENTIE